MSHDVLVPEPTPSMTLKTGTRGEFSHVTALLELGELSGQVFYSTVHERVEALQLPPIKARTIIERG